MGCHIPSHRSPAALLVGTCCPAGGHLLPCWWSPATPAGGHLPRLLVVVSRSPIRRQLSPHQQARPADAPPAPRPPPADPPGAAAPPAAPRSPAASTPPAAAGGAGGGRAGTHVRPPIELRGVKLGVAVFCGCAEEARMRGLCGAVTGLRGYAGVLGGRAGLRGPAGACEGGVRCRCAGDGGGGVLACCG